MNMDPLVIRDLLIWIAYALGSAILIGFVPTWMRCGAKRADPSAAAALFALVLSGACVASAVWKGNAAALLSFDARTYGYLALCGLLSAFVWLCLFTALTGGLVGKVFPVFVLWNLLYMTASHFLFGTSLGLWKICCIVLILLGVVFIESRTPNLKGQLWFVYALLAALAAAGAGLLRRGTLGEEFDETLFQAGRSVSACVILWIFVFARGRHRALGEMGARA